MALVGVVVLISCLALFSILLIDTVTAEVTRSAAANRGGTALQAAEAGIDDYLSKLAEDKTFYFRHVHPAESTRRPVSGVDVDPSTACTAPKTATGAVWTGSVSWSYPAGKDNWCQLANGYEYNLQVTPPSASSTVVKLVSTGRKIGSTRVSEWRALETWVHFSMITDFQMIASGNYTAGAEATTTGKVYAGGTLRHDGVATANLYSESTISGSVAMQNGAQQFPRNTIRSQIPAPIDFANFQSSLNDIQRAADAAGLHLGSSYAAWRLVFSSNGTFTVTGCNLIGQNHPAGTQPNCNGSSTAYAVPANGAVFSDVTVLVSGTVNGRVAIASNDDAVVAGNLGYAQSGDDVLGMIAKDEVIIAKWAPSTLSWRAAVIAQNGRRRSWDSTGSHTYASHLGSTATFLSPYMDMFQTRLYTYDDTLQYLPPPWFPTLGDDYVVDLFREIDP